MAPRMTLRSSGSESSGSGSVQLKDVLKRQSKKKTRSQPGSTSNERSVPLSASSHVRAQRVVDAMANPRASPMPTVHFINDSDSDETVPVESHRATGKRASGAPSDEPGQKRTKKQPRQPRSPYPTTTSDAQLVNEIRFAPRAIEIKQVVDLFRHLKTEMRKFCDDFFTFELSANQSTTWPLHLLKTEYEPLKRVTQYIADGDQQTWGTFFTSADHRPHLVYGILGEFFKQHIFAATAFGMSTEEIDELEKLDRTYMYYDAFVRAKQRADLLQQQVDTKSIIHESHDLQLAVAQFTEDLLHVLEPLLPTFMAAQSSPMRFSENASLESRLRLGLEDLVRFAARIHQSIRLTGQNGTVIRFCQPTKKGEQFNEWGPQHCINQEYIDKTRTTLNSDKPIIKMTCFSRVEAYQPFGPDQLELEEVYNTAVQDLRDASEATKAPSNRSSDQQIFDVKDLNFQWPVLPQQLQGRRSHQGSEDESVPQKSTSERGSYVVLTQLTQSDVYLEWSPKSERNKQVKVTLEQAIEEARRQKHLHHWDRICTIANTSRPYAEWVGFVVLIAWITGHKLTDINIPHPSAESIAGALKGLLDRASNTNRASTLWLVNELPKTVAALKNNSSTASDSLFRYSGGFLGLKDRNVTSHVDDLTNSTSGKSIAQAATQLGKKLISQKSSLSSVLSTVLLGSSAANRSSTESATTSTTTNSGTSSPSTTASDSQTSSWLNGVLKHFFSVGGDEAVNIKQSLLESVTQTSPSNDDKASSRWSVAIDLITALRGEKSDESQATNAAEEGWSWSQLRFPQTTVGLSEIKVTKGISFGSKGRASGEDEK